MTKKQELDFVDSIIQINGFGGNYIGFCNHIQYTIGVDTEELQNTVRKYLTLKYIDVNHQPTQGLRNFRSDLILQVRQEQSENKRKKRHEDDSAALTSVQRLTWWIPLLLSAVAIGVSIYGLLMKNSDKEAHKEIDLLKKEIQIMKNN